MGCQDNFGVFEIFYGDAKILPLRAVFEGSLLPLDLTNCKQITAMLPLAAGGFTALTLTNGDVQIAGTSPLLGQANVNISSQLSPTLSVGILQDIFAQFIITSGNDLSISSGVINGTPYCITSVGDTTQLEWQAIGLPLNIIPAVGVLFTANVSAVGSGTGIVQTLAPNSPMTVPFKKCFTVFEQ